ncbi:hypothetical protein NVP1243O_01, partial [Vibrio phage 1.243.O._10N.261.54.B5]
NKLLKFLIPRFGCVHFFAQYDGTTLIDIEECKGQPLPDDANSTVTYSGLIIFGSLFNKRLAALTLHSAI